MSEKGNLKFLRWSNPLAWGTLITVIFLILITFLAISPLCEIINSKKVCQSKFSKFLGSPPNEIGDTLAGIAGALAFLWIIITVLLQSQELRAQRQELEAQRNELILSREEAVKSNENMASQRFENTLFSIMTTYNEIVSSIDLFKGSVGYGDSKTESVTTTGRDCFKVFYDRLGKHYKRYKNNDEALTHAYLLFWSRHRLELGHYFRFLYRAFLIIDEHPLSQEHHGKILRSLLSDQELLLIYYNCLFEQGLKFKKLAVKFELFDNLPTEILLHPDHLTLMPKEALGKNPAIFNDGLKS